MFQNVRLSAQKDLNINLLAQPVLCLLLSEMLSKGAGAKTTGDAILMSASQITAKRASAPAGK
jgi:hypothetical protein